MTCYIVARDLGLEPGFHDWKPALAHSSSVHTSVHSFLCSSVSVLTCARMHPCVHMCRSLSTCAWMHPTVTKCQLCSRHCANINAGVTVCQKRKTGKLKIVSVTSTGIVMNIRCCRGTKSTFCCITGSLKRASKSRHKSSSCSDCASQYGVKCT